MEIQGSVQKKELVAYKQVLPEDDDFTVEYEILPVISSSDLQSDRRTELLNIISNTDKRIDLIEKEIAKLDAEIERLTNRADWIDYTIAVSSGLLCGLIDSFCW